MTVQQDIGAQPAVGRMQAVVSFACRHERAILAGLIALNFLPIWAFHYFPTLDGPAHVSMAYWLAHYDDPDLPIFGEFFQLTFPVVPNYLIFAILYPLSLVVSPIIAEKILISLYAVFLPLALRYALRGAAPQAGPLAILGTVFTFHKLLLLGFYNTSFALPVFLLCFGFWLRRRGSISLPTLAGYLAFSALAYVTHLSAVAATCLAIFFATSGLVARDLIRSRDRRLATAWQRLLSHGIWPALGFVPVIALCLSFMLRGGGEVAAAGVGGLGLPDITRILQLLVLEIAVGHDMRELAVSIGLLAVLFGLAKALTQGADRKVNAGLFVFLGFLLLFLVVPFRFDVRWMPTRLMPYVLFGALFWFAGMTTTLQGARRLAVVGGIVLCACVLTVAGTGIRMMRWADIADLQAEYTSGIDLIEPNSTLLALRLHPEVDGDTASDQMGIMLQMPGYIAVERGIVDLKHFQAHTRAFPLAFREEVDPYRHLASDVQYVGDPASIVPSDYTTATGLTVDYILLWGESETLPADSPLALDLADHYDLIHISSARGLARLYRLRQS